jgi:hypothetical protein
VDKSVEILWKSQEKKVPPLPLTPFLIPFQKEKKEGNDLFFLAVEI